MNGSRETEITLRQAWTAIRRSADGPYILMTYLYRHNRITSCNPIREDFTLPIMPYRESELENAFRDSDESKPEGQEQSRLGFATRPTGDNISPESRHIRFEQTCDSCSSSPNKSSR